MVNRRLLFSTLYVICVLGTTLLFHSLLSSEHGDTIAYSDFKRLLHAGKIVDAEIGDRTIRGVMDLSGTEVLVTAGSGRTRTIGGVGLAPYVTFRLEDPTLLAELQTANVRYGAERRAHWFDELLSLLLPAAAFFGIWAYALHWMEARGARRS